MATGRLPDPNTAPLTAKGDLYTYSTVPARLAVGSNGDTLVADSSTTTGLRWQSNFAAGKNKIINGDFGVWQRGTSITAGGTGYFYHADRFQSYSQSGASSTASRQTFTAGTAPVAGYEGQYFLRIVDTANLCTVSQKIEDVRTFAGQNVTFSFWAKSASNVTGTVTLQQHFGSGGSALVYATVNSGGNPAITSSWQRFTVNITVPSISGKTIGTNSFIFVELVGGTNNALDTWGWQVEAGNVATAFQTATGTLAGELAACQRYYWRNTADANYTYYGMGFAYSTTNSLILIQLPVTMRVAPTAIEYGSLVLSSQTANFAITSLTINQNSKQSPVLDAGGATGLTQFRPYALIANNTTAAFLALTAEL